MSKLNVLLFYCALLLSICSFNMKKTNLKTKDDCTALDWRCQLITAAVGPERQPSGYGNFMGSCDSITFPGGFNMSVRCRTYDRDWRWNTVNIAVEFGIRGSSAPVSCFLAGGGYIGCNYNYTTRQSIGTQNTQRKVARIDINQYYSNQNGWLTKN
jgi:hypothetical protein